METQIKQLKDLLQMACESAEWQANWDKRPYSEWYYKAKIILKDLESVECYKDCDDPNCPYTH